MTINDYVIELTHVVCMDGAREHSDDLTKFQLLLN